MKKNFEEEVFNFIVLVYNNTQDAITEKDKNKALFCNLKVNLDKEEIIAFNEKLNYSCTLNKKKIQNFNFEDNLIRKIALNYIDKLIKYLNNEISFKELADIKEESPPIVKNLLKQKNNISEQLIILRRHRYIPEVNRYVNELHNYEFLTPYQKYLIDRYYYNIKGLKRPKKSTLEKMFKLTLK